MFRKYRNKLADYLLWLVVYFETRLGTVPGLANQRRLLQNWSLAKRCTIGHQMIWLPSSIYLHLSDININRKRKQLSTSDKS